MRIRIVESTGSTNTDLIADTGFIEGDWLVALEQSAGKGRQGRQWVSAEGNFFGSSLVGLRKADPPAQTLSMVAALALADAIDAATPGRNVMLKWPNDVLLDNKKVAGILLERSGDRVAVGFGMNLASAPSLDNREASDLGAAIAPKAFAPLLAASFARMLEQWRSADPAALVRAWEERAHSKGTALSVHVSADEIVTGSFAGLEPDGALRLKLDDGRIEVIRAGDVDLK
jgi:BirA family biotin operon repressor/biotin-[acetyl-CoA-carboxylase] ligase